MRCKPIHVLPALCFLILSVFTQATMAFAQVNIGALAQFKKNQQTELARQLQGSAKAEAKVEKTGKHGKGKLDTPMVVARPALIRAQTRTFKGNYSDLRKSNMR